MPVSILAVFVLQALVSGAFAAAAPVAGQTFSYSRSFANEGQITLEELPNKIGVDPKTGDVLVSSGALGVQIFDPDAQPSDQPLGSFGSSPAAEAIAVADNGDVYVGNTYGIAKYLRGPSNPPNYTLDTSYAPKIKSSGSEFALDPNDGDLLIARIGPEEGGTPGNRYEIVRLDPAGNEVSAFPVPSGFLAREIAVAKDGTIFAHSYRYEYKEVPSRDRVLRFSSSGQRLANYYLPVQKPGRAIPPLVSSLSWDPQNEVVDVSYQGGGYPLSVDGVDSQGELVYNFRYPETESRSAGSAVDPVRGRLYGLTLEPPSVQVFDRVVNPGVEPPVVSDISSTTAHLTALVDPGAGPPSGSVAFFEYSSDGGFNWLPTAEKEDTSSQKVEATLTFLKPHSRYLVRTVARTDQATHASKPVQFNTLGAAPIAITDPGSSITEREADLNARIDPLGQATSYHFDFGSDQGYGKSIPVTGEPTAGSGQGLRTVIANVSDLEPNSTYHYRIVAHNASGYTYGGDRTFTTPPLNSLGNRIYEQVTPVDKNGGFLIGGFGFQLSETGSSVSYIVKSADNTLSSPLYSRFVSEREASGWSSDPTDPPMHSSPTTVFDLTLAISSDFSHAFVASNLALAPGAVNNATNLYIEDLNTKSYSLVAVSEGLSAYYSFAGQFFEKFVGGSPDFDVIFFHSVLPLIPGTPREQLYRWSQDKGLTLASHLPDGSPPDAQYAAGFNLGPARYNSLDGSKVYFALANGSDAGVYLNQNGIVLPISVSQRPGDPQTPQAGEVLAVSDDGRYAFFDTFSAQLTEDSPAEPNNIYRYDAVDRSLVWIGNYGGFGAMARTDAVADVFAFSSTSGVKIWRGGVTIPVGPQYVDNSRGFMSPDGRYVAYATTEEEEGDVFLYDVAAAQNDCVTCLADGTETKLSRILPADVLVSHYQPSPFGGDSLFFTSKRGLVADDVNGTSDVYEVGNHGVRLVSPGEQPFNAKLAAIAPDGHDVFFSTAQGLVGQDVDKQIDLYDARIGGGLPEQNATAEKQCAEVGCGSGQKNPRGGASTASEAIRGSNVKIRRPSRRCRHTSKHSRARGSRCVRRKSSGQSKRSSKRKARPSQVHTGRPGRTDYKQESYR